MSEIISPNALTTLARVKDRLYDTNVNSQPTNFDTVLIRMINSASEWFERECGARKFILTRYTNEIYSAYGADQKRVVLRKAPVFFTVFTGNTTLGSTSVTAVSNTTGMVVGMPFKGDNIQANTTIAGVSGSTITLSLPATSGVTTGYFQVNGLISLQWRAGTPSTPSWTNFINDQYELVNDGKPGIVRVYGVIPRLYENMIRATYYAGYPVDWANAGNETTHQLPADISNTVENLVVRIFKRRMLAGKSSESLNGANVSWNKEVDDDDRAVIGHYRRMPTIF
jgi:hypothetical protein